MALKVICFLILIGFCSIIEARIRISTAEKWGLKRQLRILNKSPIKTIQTNEGDILDCIDINKQPAHDHPTLKDHKIQTRPSSFPKGMSITSPEATLSDINPSRESCPIGTVPIRRTEIEDFLRAQQLFNHSRAVGVQSNQKPYLQHTLGVFTKGDSRISYHGASAIMSVYSLDLVENQVSSSAMWILSGGPGERNGIITGWTVNPALFKDNRARLYAYWTADDFKTGCYNTYCSGFVQIHKHWALGISFYPTSTYGGQQYEERFTVFQDTGTGNWWLVLGNDAYIGYWPKEIFTHLAYSADTVAYGGTAMTSSSGLSPPMGSGHKPDGNYQHATFFRDVSFVNEYNALQSPPDDATGTNVDETGCYGLQDDKTGGPFKSYSFTYGGPGGACWA